MAVRKLSLIEQAGLSARLLRALPGFLRTPVDSQTARTQIRADLERRGENLVRMITGPVLSDPGSPYRALLEHAGANASDIREMVHREGVEGALERLYDVGVYVSLDEFKGRSPIVRGSLRLEVSARDFDNPLISGHYMAQSGASRRSGTRITIDLAHNARSAIYDLLLIESQGVVERPYVIWQPTLPYGAGLNAVLRYAKLGRQAASWFTQNRPALAGREWQHGWLTRAVIASMRAHGVAVPYPRHISLARADRVAQSLARLKARGTPALVNTNASSGTRVCLAASASGVDISGTVFRLGGEPLTDARARVVASTGSRAVAIYGMGEVGRIGLPCAHPAAIDDVHLLIDKLAAIRRARRVGDGAAPVAINVYTTLVRSTPKLLLNVESDDFGDMHERSCGCLLDQLGLTRHLHTIRSHEKLTSEGMNFLGHDLIRLLEEFLPARFGGGPTDYQLAEIEEANGLPAVQLVVSPRLGRLSEEEIADFAVDFLNSLPGSGGRYGERWREGETLRVVRREPYATAASKVLSLHTWTPAGSAE